jgi:type I restriction enzyme, S subunit
VTALKGDAALKRECAWPMKALESVTESTDYVANGSFASLKANVTYRSEPDYAVLVRFTDFAKGWKQKFVYVDERSFRFLRKSNLSPGDVVVSNVGEPGRVFRVPDLGRPMTLGPNAVLIRPNEELGQGFLAYFLSSPAGQMLFASITTGTAQRKFNKTMLRRLEVPVPALTEQRSIVSEIEKQFTRLDAGVAALQRVQANLKRYRAAILKAACEGHLVLTEAELCKAEKRKFETGEELLARILSERRQNWQGRGKYKEPSAPNIRTVALIPSGWTWASVDQLAHDTMIGLDRGRAQQSEDPAVGVPYIKMNNVTMDGRVTYRDLVFVPASGEEMARFALQDGDILFNTRNSKELVGKVGLARNPPAGALYNNNLMRIRVPSGISPAFLALQMCSREFRQRMELVKKATTSVAAVYSKDLLPLGIALPSFAEQTRIVAELERRLSVVEELEDALSANLRRATCLRQSILQRAFTVI